VVVGRAAGDGGVAASDDNDLGAVSSVGRDWHVLLRKSSSRSLDLDLAVGDLVDHVAHGRLSHEGSEGE